MFEKGRPRYWIDWYDPWYLLLPLFLVLVLAAAWWLPKPATAAHKGVGVAVRVNPPVQRVPSTVAQPVPSPAPPTPTFLDSPQHGKGYFQSRLTEAEGRAEPGAEVRLEYAEADLVWHELSRMPVAADGRFRFQLKDFPPGSYRLRARALTASGQTSDSAAAMITVMPDPARPTRAARRRTR